MCNSVCYIYYILYIVDMHYFVENYVYIIYLHTNNIVVWSNIGISRLVGLYYGHYSI